MSKISQYSNVSILQSGDMLVVARSGVNNFNIKIKDLLDSYKWESLIISGTNVLQANYNHVRISGGDILLPAWNQADPNNYQNAIRFINYSGGNNNELGSLYCWGDHGGVINTPEIILRSTRDIAIVPGQDGSIGTANVQLGSSGPVHETFSFQYDVDIYSNYGNDGITAYPFGHSKRVLFVSPLASGATTKSSIPGIVGTNSVTGDLVDQANNGGVNGDLSFYSLVPQYPFTSYPGIRMGRMLTNGWELNGKQTRERADIASTNSFTIDFNKPISQLTSITTTGNINVVTSNLPSNSTVFQEVNAVIKSGPFTPGLSFPNWQWGGQTGVPSSPTGLLPNQAIYLNLKSIGTGDINILASYSIYSFPFSYDNNAQIFFNSGNITDTTQKLAINSLVTNAKANGWWDKSSAIYPFVGQNTGSHSFNLKSPSSYRILWSGALTGSAYHTAFGISGNGTDAFGNTTFKASNNSSISSFHGAVYCRDIANPLIPGRLIGAVSTAGSDSRIGIYPTSSALMIGEGINANIATGPLAGGNPNHKALYVETMTGGSITSLYRNSSRAGDNVAATTVNCSQDIMLLARGYEAFSPDNWSNSNIAFASFGSGLSPTEVSNMYNDIQAFQTILSRNV